MIPVLSRWVPGTRCAATILALVLAHQSGATDDAIGASTADLLRWVAVSVAVAVLIMGWVLDRSLESTTNRLDRTHKRLIAKEDELARLQAVNEAWARANPAWGRTVGDETAIQRPDPRFRR